MVITTMRFHDKKFEALSAIVDLCHLQARYGNDNGVGVGDVMAVTVLKRSTLYHIFSRLCEDKLIECVSTKGVWKFVPTNRGYAIYDNLWKR